ncbi:MAG: hypothetical protein LBT14_09880 [Treponema sp.]|jgi:hypothetical protein|nr:hypothetical protein [Treponema sp.]
MVNKKRMVGERTMKKMLFLAIMSLCATAAFCQDIIVMKNGDEVEAIIKEIGPKEVKYIEHGNPDGVLYTVLKSDVFQIKYENGKREMFSEAVANTPAVNENFTGGQRVGTWAINSILPGVGSFVIMGDNFGGGIQLGAGVLAYILIIAGVADIVKGSELYEVQTSPGNPDIYNYKPPTTEWVNDEDTLNGGIAMTVIGGLLLTANGIFNIARSAMYDKPAPAVASGFDPSGLQLAVLAGNKVGISYTLRF